MHAALHVVRYCSIPSLNEQLHMATGRPCLTVDHAQYESTHQPSFCLSSISSIIQGITLTAATLLKKLLVDMQLAAATLLKNLLVNMFWGAA